MSGKAGEASKKDLLMSGKTGEVSKNDLLMSGKVKALVMRERFER